MHPVNQAGYSSYWVSGYTGYALCTVRLPSTCSSSSLHDASARDDDIFLHFALESLQNTMLPKKGGLLKVLNNNKILGAVSDLPAK